MHIMSKWNINPSGKRWPVQKHFTPIGVINRTEFGLSFKKALIFCQSLFNRISQTIGQIPVKFSKSGKWLEEQYNFGGDLNPWIQDILSNRGAFLNIPLILSCMMLVWPFFVFYITKDIKDIIKEKRCQLTFFFSHFCYTAKQHPHTF